MPAKQAKKQAKKPATDELAKLKKENSGLKRRVADLERRVDGAEDLGLNLQRRLDAIAPEAPTQDEPIGVELPIKPPESP